MAWFKQAYDSAPQYDAALTSYAAAAIQAGQPELASSLLVPRYGTLTPDDDTLLAAYVNVKDYASALTIMKNRVAKDPGNAQDHEQLAVVYLDSGDKASAISELTEAIKLNPSFAAQGQYYIQQIQGQ